MLAATLGFSVSCGPDPAGNKAPEARPKEVQSQISRADAGGGPVAAAAAAAPSSSIAPAPGPPVPGLDGRRLIAPLQDAYDRLDPLRDGWQSEAFSTEAAAQLQKLKSLISAPAEITPEDLEEVATADVLSVSLRPAGAGEVFRQGGWRVLRASGQGPKGTGLERLATALNELKSGGTKIEPLLKITGVARQKETVETAVVVSLALNSSAERRQIGGEWTCRWQVGGEGPPRLSALLLASFEEVIYENPRPLFADVSAQVFADSQSYRSQWLVPTDHWRSRLPRDLGLDPVANHGLAIGDVNGDHLDDLYVCQQGGLPNRLYLQRENGTLHEITQASGADWLDYCAAALMVDLDNDGDRDLVISQDFRILFMDNDGQARFTLRQALSTKAQSFSLAAADYDSDGFVDVYVCGYNPSTAALRGGAMGEPLPFHDANNGGRNILWRNEGGFQFTDVTAAVGLDVNNTRFSFAAAWEDFDNDGDQDLYVANDYGRNNLYRNEQGRFSDIATAFGVEDTASGMSVSWSDFDHDGAMDLYVSNMFSSAGHRITSQQQFKPGAPAEVRAQFQHLALGNTLFQGDGGRGFKDVSVPAGVTLGRWAWASKFADINNDGYDDILVANGFITTTDTGDL